MSDENAPWVLKCKQLAVGQSARFRCCGRTPAGVLHNKPEAWEFFCFRCKSRGFVRKQYVSLVHAEVLPKHLPTPTDLKSINDCTPELQAFCWGFIVSRGLMPEMAGAVYYSEQLKRLVWDLQNGTYLARALHQYQQPKWVMLGQPAQYAAAQPLQHSTDMYVLTEDWLSALKIQWVSKKYSSAPVTAVSLLGTRLSLALKASLIQMNKPVLLMLDNDEAGWTGAKTIQRTLKPFLTVHDRVLRDDPKVCNISEILEGLKW